MKKIYIEKETVENSIHKNSSMRDICKDLNIDIATLKRICSEYNLELPRGNARRGKILPTIRPDIDKDWLIENWVNTAKSMRQLAVENNISESILDQRRAKYGLKKAFKYPIDTVKLFNPADPNIAYIAGLIATDGFLLRDKNSFEIELHGESETHLLEDIYNYFDRKAAFRKYGPNFRLRISADGLNQFFESEFNIKSGPKSYDISVPKNFYNEDCVKAYIRGCIDGDGSISSTPGIFNLLSASFDFVDGLHEIILKYSGIDIPVRVMRSGSHNRDYFLLAAGPGAINKVKLFLDWVYSGPGFKLERKYVKYLNTYYSQG